MLDFFYTLAILPLEEAMRFILETAHALTASWGLSLVLMSVCVNIALIPLYHLAESWQEEERNLQNAMADKLAEIRAVFHGRERFMYVKTLYRQHGYSPLRAIRGSFGLLIQIPFFFAAFHLLNSAPELVGQPFLFLSDLAAQDALLTIAGLHINLLPFIMTGVNLASAAVYTTRLTRREKVQLYGLAAIFLVLLYTSSAALLVYWTCNNLFSFCKNIVYVRFIYSKPTSHGGAESILSMLPPALGRAPAFICAALLLTVALVMRRHMTGSPLTIAACALAALACWAGFLARLSSITQPPTSQRAKNVDSPAVPPAEPALTQALPLPLFILIACALALLIGELIPARRVFTTTRWWCYAFVAVSAGGLSGWLLTAAPLLKRLAAWEHAASLALGSSASKLFWAGAALTASITCLYTPAGVYASDPHFFFEPFGSLAAAPIQRALIFFVFCYAISRSACSPARLTAALTTCRTAADHTANSIAGKAVDKIANHARNHDAHRAANGTTEVHRSGIALTAIVLAFTALCAATYTYIVPADYGLMDDVIFRSLELLHSRVRFLIDPMVFAACAAIIALCLWKRLAGMLAGLMQTGALAVALAGACIALTAPQVPTQIVSHTDEPPAYAERFFSFSATGKNTLVIMLDMFCGGHMERILAEHPALAEKLEGFVWYADTVSGADVTFASLPSILAGPGYTPQAINARAPRFLLDEINKAYATLPNAMLPRGVAFSSGYMDGYDESTFKKHVADADDALIVHTLERDFISMWRKSKGLPGLAPASRGPFLAAMGFFHAAPWMLRPGIYDAGNWLGTSKRTVNPSEGALSLLQSFPSVSNTLSPSDTYKFIPSQLTHAPWRINAETCMPANIDSVTPLADGAIKEHLDSEYCALAAIAEWAEWMKTSGVYDNTHIIIVSDHDGGESPMMGEAFDDLRKRALVFRPHALLLEKTRNARGTLRVDGAYMSTTDIPALIQEQNTASPRHALFTQGTPENASRVRTHDASPKDHKTRNASDTRYATTPFEVRGSMFERGNWQQLTKE